MMPRFTGSLVKNIALFIWGNMHLLDKKFSGGYWGFPPEEHAEFNSQCDVSASVENGELVLRGDYIVEMDIARQVEIPVTQYSQEKDEKKPARAGGY